MTKFLLSIESVLDSFGFTKQRGICGSLRLTPFLRFFRKAEEIKIRRRALWGVQLLGKEGGGREGGGSKKLHFSHFFRAPLFAHASPRTLSLRSSLFVNGTEKCRLSLRLAT